ncbi:MAG: class I adenylate-forming enzyme family protein [Alphaproteobacteria bacterium]|nr:class I adenylate-forming enzyme family protein [Alphaproteobacteria bacterium]
MNPADILAEHARTRPDHPAIEDGDRIVNYGELNDRVASAAANLQRAGIEPGDIVGIMLPDSADYLITLCAVANAGAVTFAIDPQLPPREKECSLVDVPVKAIIAQADAQPVPNVTRLPLDRVVRPQAENPEPFVAPNLQPDHPHTFVQTSGTTGNPKRLLLSHAQRADFIERNMRTEGWVSTDRYLAVVQMTFSIGRVSCIGMLHIGATVVINSATSAAELVSRVQDQRITILRLTSAHLRGLLDHAAHRSADDLPLFPNLRMLAVTAAPTAHELRLLVRTSLTPNLLERYGTNEIGVVAVSAPPDQDAYPDSLGRVIDGIQAQVVDANDQPLPSGQAGLIGFRGPRLPTEYYRNAEATAQCFRDGWFYPGDLAALNEDGYVFFKGRADDVINNQGAKFYPVEIETVLLSHPAVTEAAVFGWPHKQFGECAVAVVVAKAQITAEALAQFCRERIAAYKVPVWIMFVSAMPKNPMGKIVKARLREMFRGQTARQSE